MHMHEPELHILSFHAGIENCVHIQLVEDVCTYFAMIRMDQLENIFCCTREALHAKKVFERQLIGRGSYKPLTVTICPVPPILLGCPGVRMTSILRLNLLCERLSELAEARKKTHTTHPKNRFICVVRQIFRHEARAQKFGPSMVY